jgi:type IV secretory pathway VirD2 relaxase
MSRGGDDLRVRPGRIRDRGPRIGGTKSLVGQVMAAARKAGLTGNGLGRAGSGGSGSRFGRGRMATLQAALRSSSRRVVIKARVVRHRGVRFRAASLATHLGYLKREGVTRDGASARLFDANGDEADGRAFAGRCEEDRHHFRFIVSPEDAPAMADLRAFTRDLMTQAARDLGTRLDWVAIDHWNTDNPHVHILVRGVAEDGQDLVIARDYIGKGLRARAEAVVDLELGPRSEREIRSALQAEVTAERWTRLDQALQAVTDDAGGVADLRPGASAAADPELRRLMIGRAQVLERLGLAEPLGPASWALRPQAEATLRELATRGDIIRTMHRALQGAGVERPASDLAIHGDTPNPVTGRLLARGLDDELKGTAYAVIDGTDGRVHHIRFVDLDATSDAPAGAVVEFRRFADARGQERTALAVRSDLPIEQQVAADGATWLDRRLLDRAPVPLAANGFGVEVGAALTARTEHLVSEGLARRQGQRVVFVRDLLNTLRRRELDVAAVRASAETGLVPRPAEVGQAVTGVYRQRLDLASGRFAMIGDGLGFQLVPWKPSLEREFGRQVSGVMLPDGGVTWTPGRRRGPSIG